MLLYGKLLEDGKIEFAQQNYKGILNFNTDEKLMKENGFLPVVDTPVPDYDNSYQDATYTWVNENDTLVKKWEIIDVSTKEEVTRDIMNELTLTPSDVERALYQAKGIVFSDIIEMLKDNPDIDTTALGIEFRANLFYRQNPYVNQIGQLLGYTSSDMDYLFLNKKLP